MTYQEKKEKIIGWLKDNNIFKQFTDHAHALRPDYDPFAKELLDESLITKSFIWMHTPETSRFWININKEYREFYKNLMTNEMEKSIKIEIPEGYEIDEKKSTFENIVFKKKEVKSWRKGNHNINGYYIEDKSNILFIQDGIWTHNNYNVFATKKQAKSTLAMAQISQIMVNDPRFGGPISDEEWLNLGSIKYTITRDGGNIIKNIFYHTYAFLAFHTSTQRDLFLNENEDLVKEYLMLD